MLVAACSGADAILLIAAVLPNQDLQYLMKAASALGMTCLIEVHTEAELTRVLRLAEVDQHLLGINNRDLGTFKVGGWVSVCGHAHDGARHAMMMISVCCHLHGRQAHTCWLSD